MLFIVHQVQETCDHFQFSFYQGAVPFLVSCTSGTTVQGAMDPLDRIADVCEEHKLWMHVDVSPAVEDKCVCLPASVVFVQNVHILLCVSGLLGRERALFRATQTSDERC